MKSFEPGEPAEKVQKMEESWRAMDGLLGTVLATLHLNTTHLFTENKEAKEVFRQMLKKWNEEHNAQVEIRRSVYQ